jgi:hypothetical protein
MFTLSPDHTPAVRCVTDEDKAYADVFTTALEGGIGYWSACSRYKWSVDGTLDGQALDFIAVVQDVEDDEAPTYVIDREVIRRGISALYVYLRSLGDEANRYHQRAARDLSLGHYDDADYDADTADMVVQFGLFNELRYS